MSFLSTVTKGKIKKPNLVLLYGVDGIGKSTWAAQAPEPIFLGPEDGTNNLNVSRFSDIKSWQSVISALNELIDCQHSYKTLVIDTLDWLELMLWSNIIGSSGKNINTVNGGYGAGREEAKLCFKDMISSLNSLRESKKMNIILLAHSEVKPFADPRLNETYDRYELKLDKKSSALFREYCDDVLFSTFKAFVKKDDGKQAKTFSDGVRVVYTERRPAFDAKR
jgi:hypothetical protein